MFAAEVLLSAETFSHLVLSRHCGKRIKRRSLRKDTTFLQRRAAPMVSRSDLVNGPQILKILFLNRIYINQRDSLKQRNYFDRFCMHLTAQPLFPRTSCLTSMIKIMGGNFNVFHCPRINCCSRKAVNYFF